MRAGLAALLISVGLVMSGCTLTTAEPAPASVASPVTPGSSSHGTDPDSGLRLVDLTTLPPEAAETMARIRTGGPFPYPQDGAVFENRERILPDADRGYYHEYTVETPGSPDRGARRIVVGNQGEAYWTDDHYASFRRIGP